VNKTRNQVKDWIAQKRFIFPLLAFLLPLVIRAVPEILMGPYVIGFDTIGFYIPNSLLWLHGGLNLGDFLSTAPLFYTIYMSIVAIGGSPVYVLKIISPLLLGFLGVAMYGYAKKGLIWSSSKSVFAALLGTIYFVALRASWDQLREELGLIFFFVTIMLMLSDLKSKSWKRYLVLSLSMMAVVMSHQLVSVLMFGVIIVTVVRNLLQKDFNESVRLIVTSLPAVLYFFILYSRILLYSGIGYSNDVSPLTGFVSYESMMVNTGGFFLYCFLPLLPLVVVGLWKFGNLQLKSWLFVSFVLSLLPLSFVNPYRWILMLVYPFAFYATDALSGLKLSKWKNFKQIFRKTAMLYLILSTAILSVGFIFTTPEDPFFYFNVNALNSYSYQIPTSMLQNTISIADCHNVVKTLQWFKDSMNSSALLLTHRVFYGWALLTIDRNQAVNYEFDDPVNAAMLVTREGNTQIYIIWWVNGKGWDGLSSLPQSFHEIYRSGDMALYQYSPNG
jgi:hypothetical protein